MYNLFLVYFINFYVFRLYLGPSSGGTTVCIQQLVIIILFRFSDDCLFSWLDWNQDNRQSSKNTYNSYLVIEVPDHVYVFYAYRLYFADKDIYMIRYFYHKIEIVCVFFSARDFFSILVLAILVTRNETL